MAAGLALTRAGRLFHLAGVGLRRGLCLLAGLPFGHCRLPSGSASHHRDACTATSRARGARRAATQEGPSTGTAMLAVRGKSSGIGDAQDFYWTAMASYCRPPARPPNRLTRARVTTPRE